MSADAVITPNFARPFPLLPLDIVPLFPRGVVPLHVADRPYTQLVTDALDGSGLVAVAVYRTSRTGQVQTVAGLPAVRPAVCVGRIIEHERLAAGRYNVAIHGVCRARITRELAADDATPYRRVMLEPLDQGSVDDAPLTGVREELVRMLDSGPLTSFRDASVIAQHVKDREIPAAAILELLSLTFISDSEVRYKLLAEGDLGRRGAIVVGELGKLQRLIRLAEPQRTTDAPKGCSWN
jgi:hypothetical protein